MCRGETDTGVNSITLGTELLEFGSTAPAPPQAGKPLGLSFSSNLTVLPTRQNKYSKSDVCQIL